MVVPKSKNLISIFSNQIEDEFVNKLETNITIKKFIGVDKNNVNILRKS